MSTHVAYLSSLRACSEAVEWAERYPSLSAAWAACERGDWMLWLAGRSGAYGEPWSAERRPLVAAAVACARLVLPIFEGRRPGDSRVRDCLDTMDRWCRGEATNVEARASASAATYAAYAASATYAADAAAYAADAATYATYAAYAASAASAADAARSAMRRQCADVVRAMLPCPEVPA